MSRPPPETASHRPRRRVPRGGRRAAATFTATEVLGLLRPANELHYPPHDPEARKRQMLEGLWQLLDADAGVCVVTHAAPPSGARIVVNAVRWGMSGDDDCAFAASFQLPGEGRSTFASPGDPETASHCVESDVTLAGGLLRACVALFRRQARREAFSTRQQAMLDVFHSESAWLYQLDLPLVSPAGLSLTPRRRQTLQLLLARQSEKQIAARLGLSPNTVHHYVKAIHRHFRVSSRSELLARWVSK